MSIFDAHLRSPTIDFNAQDLKGASANVVTLQALELSIVYIFLAT